MSNFNFNWLKNNFLNDNLTIYNIGCADLCDSAKFNYFLPNATVYAFECAKQFCDQVEHNKNYNLYNINFFPFAVTYTEKKLTLNSQHRNAKHPGYVRDKHKMLEIARQCSTLQQNVDKRDKWDVIDRYEVQCISLNKFCETHPKPDVIHIDVEREEFNVLKDLKSEYWPSIIYASGQDSFYNDEKHEDTIPQERLIELCVDKGMRYEFVRFNDNKKGSIFFVDKNLSVTDYIDLNEEQNQILDQEFRKDKWIRTYNICKGSSWPDIKQFNDFFQLPDNVMQELTEFNALPDKDLLK